MRIVEYTGQPDPMIHVFMRDEHGNKVQFTDIGFKPYFYVRAIDRVPNLKTIACVDNKHKYVSVDGIKLKRIYVKHPKDVVEARKHFEYTWEADIPFVDRYRLDNPEYDSSSPRVLFFDIETQDLNVHSDKPMMSITMYDNNTEWYFSFVWRPELKRDSLLFEDGFIDYFDNEHDMLETFVDVVNFIDPDIIAGWFSNDFDFPYLYNRLRKNKIDSALLSPLRYVNEGRNKIAGRICLDLLPAYRKVAGGTMDSYRLCEIAKQELGYGKTEDPGDLTNIWEEDPMRLVEYNKRDVHILVELDKKLKIVDFFDMLCNEVNISMDDSRFNTKIVDMYMLRIARELGVVLPTKIRTEENEVAIEGAKVFEPEPGLKNDIAVYDLKSLYPSIIVSFNMSPETVLGKMEFKQDIVGIMPYALRHLFKQREQLKRDGSVRRQRVVKEIMNTFYGATLFRGFRLRNRHMGESITYVGRKILEWTRAVMESEGYNVVYGDSVLGETPILIRKGNRVDYVPIADLYTLEYDGRQEVAKIEIMSDKGWTPIKYVYRHHTDKDTYSVNAYGGRVDCTEDHSLVVDNKEVKPLETDRVELIDYKLPQYLVESNDKAWILGFFCAEGSMSQRYKNGDKGWVISISCADKELLYECQNILWKYGLKIEIYNTIKSSGVYKLNVLTPEKAKKFFEPCFTAQMDKKVPKRILNSNIKTKKAFYDGYFVGDGHKALKDGMIELDSIDQSLMAGIVQILKDMGESVTISTRKDKLNVTRCRINKNPTNKRIKDKKLIRSVNKHPKSVKYVYDIETENHHFVGGVGNVLLHNTDSVFVEGVKNHTKALDLLDTINASYDDFVSQYGLETHQFKIELEYIADRAFFVSVKKRYALRVDGEIKITGFEARRSSTPRYGREVQKGLLRMLLDGAQAGDIKRYLNECRRKVRTMPLEEIGLPASVNKPLKDYKNLPQHIRAVKWSNEHLGREFGHGSKVILLFIERLPHTYREETDVIALEMGDELPRGITLDYDEHIKRCVDNVTKSIVSDLDNMSNGVSLDSYFNDIKYKKGGETNG